MVHNTAFVLLFVATLGACRRETVYTDRERRQPSTTQQTQHLLPLSWIANDYTTARDRASKQHKPLLIDMWAGWCHTCLSMKQFVLVDPVLRPTLRRFVRLAVDTENQRNAALLSKLPLKVWPTFFVIDPRTERVVSRYLGAASATQLAAFLRAALDTMDDSAGTARRALIAARDGDRAAVRGDVRGADVAYSRALSLAPKRWARRPDVLVSLIGARHQAGRFDACVSLGLGSADQTGSSASAADFLYYAVDCAEKLPETKGRASRRETMLRLAAKRLQSLLAPENRALSIDDRSDAMRILRVVFDSLGEGPRARAWAERQRALLDRAAASAKTPAAAAIFNWPRAEVAVYLGKGSELVAELQRSCEELPDAYDPPYRLAWLLHKIGQRKPALAAAKRSLRLAYGPRKARVAALIAELEGR